MTAKTNDPLVSPVTNAEAANFIGADDTDPILPGLLLSATDAVIRAIQYDLEPRDWKLTLWEWPIVGTRTAPNLARAPYSFKREIELPYAALISVTSVTSYGDPVTDFTQRETSIIMPRGLAKETYKDNDDPAIVVEYRAGFDPVPEPIRQAIIMVAAFLFEHRGACDGQEALWRSGAKSLLVPWMKQAVVF